MVVAQRWALMVLVLMGENRATSFSYSARSIVPSSRTRRSLHSGDESISVAVVTSEDTRDSEGQQRTAIAQTQLLGTAALWGTYPTAIKLLYSSPGAELDAPLITLIRFAVMALAASLAWAVSGGAMAASEPRSSGVPLDISLREAPPPWGEQLENRVPASLVLCALEVGLLGWVGTFCNSTGLASVSALKGGILLSFINVFTPMASTVGGATRADRQVPGRVWRGCAFALAASAFALLPDSAATALPAAAAAGAAAPPAAYSLSAAFGEDLVSPGGALLLGAALAFSSAKVPLVSLACQAPSPPAPTSTVATHHHYSSSLPPPVPLPRAPAPPWPRAGAAGGTPDGPRPGQPHG